MNHRDEKSMLGVGQAQVRNEQSVRNIPAVAAFAMLHLAAIKAYGQGGKLMAIPEAKWRSPSKKKRLSPQDLINELRRELWAKAIHPEILNDFINNAHSNTKSIKYEPDICSSLFVASA